jgi:hypothetical protein
MIQQNAFSTIKPITSPYGTTAVPVYSAAEAQKLLEADLQRMGVKTTSETTVQKPLNLMLIAGVVVVVVVGIMIYVASKTKSNA